MITIALNVSFNLGRIEFLHILFSIGECVQK